ncbi:hypothetical protein Q3G72_026287 [Acer saccharum]|nr:hypothetical protein Q3G72_026131 [Acer saccharum]KAK1565426.1 hypothetical protein Q3G72_026287 [Acer saccharum]
MEGSLLRLGVCQFSFQMLMIAIVVNANFLVGSIKKEEVPVVDRESAAKKIERDVVKPIEDGPLESAAIQSEETPSGVV